MKGLDRQPFYALTAATVYMTPANYKSVLAKCYAGLSLHGQQGPAIGSNTATLTTLPSKPKRLPNTTANRAIADDFQDFLSLLIRKAR